MLSGRGRKVLVVPESATKLIMGGVTPWSPELEKTEFQEEILFDTLMQYERFLSAAIRYRNKGRKVVVLCDRGAMDGMAYVEEAAFLEMVQRLGFSLGELCQERYHAAIHLRTAAFGKEAFYTLANNEARKETPEEARVIDERTLQAWKRHPHPRVIDNSTDFSEKIHRLCAEVCNVIGDPVPLEKEDKFLIGRFELRDIPVQYHVSHITQDYLVSPSSKEEHRVRMRVDHGDPSFYYTIKEEVEKGIRVERDRIIDGREYNALLLLRDKDSHTIKKRRACFFWQEQFCEADLVDEPRSDLALLEMEWTDRGAKRYIPPFFRIIRNVTGDPEYSNRAIARRGKR